MNKNDLEFFPADIRSYLNEAAEAWADFEHAMTYSDRFLAYGKPGSGKTSSASKVGLNGRSLIRTMITAETCRPEILGHWGLGPQGMTWLDGPGVQAWRQGARLVVDEIDQAGGDAIPALHAIGDDNAIARISLGNGETVTPRKGFQLFATMNSDPLSLPEALRDRFVVKRQIDKPNPNVLFSLPMKVRAAAANALYSPRPSAEFRALQSTRVWVEIGRLHDQCGLSIKDCLRVIGVDTAAHKAIEVAEIKASVS